MHIINPTDLRRALEIKLKGKKMKPQETDEPRIQKLTIRLSKSEVTEIEETAKMLNIPKGTLIRNLVMTGVEDAKVLKKIGVIDLIKGISNTSNFIKKFTMTKEVANLKS
jgi:hypothetical protein